MELGYAVVRGVDRRHGIITDASIRRLVATGRPMTLPVSEAVALDPPTVELGASATEALIKLLEHDADFVLVTDRGGELRGVVAPIDFVASSTTAGAALHEQLRRASSLDELQTRFRQVPQLVGDLMARGLASSRVITVHSALIDTLVRRTIALVMRAHPELDPDAFTWLSLGSNGRREAVLSSDMDAAVAFSDELTATEIARYRPALVEITRALDAAGFNHDAHGVSPLNPAFARTQREWEAAARAWLTRPAQDDAIIMTCLVVDARPIHGDLALPTVARVFGELRLHPTAMKMLLAISVDRSDALRGRWRRKTVDVKARALLPITNIARWAALSAGASTLATRERLHDAAGTRMLTVEDAETLDDTFEIVQRMRLRRQLEQLQAGERPTDTICWQDMSAIEAGVLKESIREILVVQRRMANKARYVPELHSGSSARAAT
jgi:CBS domain-containing protein